METDGHAELVRPCSSTCFLGYPNISSLQHTFPETSRQRVSSPQGAQGAAGQHMRRKSAIPVDPSVLRELAGHRSLDQAEPPGDPGALPPTQ
jgi:hypothetical protein